MAHSHHNHGAPAAVVEGRTGFRRTAAFIIGGLTSGHGVFHWIAQSFIVVMPEVRDLLSGRQQRRRGQHPVDQGGRLRRGFPAGRRAHRRPPALLGLGDGGVHGLFGIGWLLMASAGWLVPGATWVAQTSGAGEQVPGQLNPAGYALLLFGMAVVGVAASVWHLPAMAALSSHFRERRGSVLSFHGVGGNVGDVIGPPLTGVLLVALSWQAIISIYAVVPIFLAFLVFWAFRDIGHRAQEAAGTQTAEALRSQLAETKLIVRNARVWGIVMVAGLRGMAYLGFVTVLPLYLADELGLIAEGEGGRSFENLALRGGLIGLLVFVGIFASPVTGYLSDRFGRKLILIPGLIALGVITLLMAPFGDTLVVMSALLAALGLFLYSDQPILTAAAIDIVREGTAATTLGCYPLRASYSARRRRSSRPGCTPGTPTISSTTPRRCTRRPWWCSRSFPCPRRSRPHEGHHDTHDSGHHDDHDEGHHDAHDGGHDDHQHHGHRGHH